MGNGGRGLGAGGWKAAWKTSPHYALAHSCSREGSSAYILSCAPPLAGRSKFKEKKGFPPLCLLAHPRFLGVGGEQSETEGGGFRRKLKNGAQ